MNVVDTSRRIPPTATYYYAAIGIACPRIHLTFSPNWRWGGIDLLPVGERRAADTTY